MRAVALTMLCLGVLGGSLCLGQPYRCDWSVNGIGGGEMSSSLHRCGATVGQTAAGLITGLNYWALIGYWQPEGQTGVREQAYSPNQDPLVTRLYAPKPNPFRTHIAVLYSLSASGRASVQVCDLAGRVVRTLLTGQQKPGSYRVHWDGRDAFGRGLANGVYFLKFLAGDYRQTEKLVLQR